MPMEHKIFPQITKIIMSKMHSTGRVIMLDFKLQYRVMVIITEGTGAQTHLNPWNKLADLDIHPSRLSILSQSKCRSSRKQRTANASKAVRKGNYYSLEIHMEVREKKIIESRNAI